MFSKTQVQLLFSAIARLRPALILALCLLAGIGAAALIPLLHGSSVEAQAPTCTLSEGFDDINTLAGSGWAQINRSSPPGTTGWFQGNPNTFASQAGSANSYVAANFNNTAALGTISNWLITPVQTLQNGEQLTFYTRVSNPNFPDRLQVRMSLNGASTNVGSSATDVGDFTTLLLDINPNYTATDYPNTWTQFTVTLSGIPAPTTGRLAFRYFVENAGQLGANSNYIGIDTVQFCSGGATATPTPTPTPTPLPTGTPDTCALAPSYSVHMSPSGFGESWGEPSIGVNWKSEKIFNGTPNGGTVMSYGGINFLTGGDNVTTALRVTFD